ncbi:MAG TPA: shikimate kinase [Taishania sp.]|nr:shikimate kinase [Taishania sp.]
MNIILVGYMGCGKSTLGKQLAKRYNLQFIDTDLLIETETQLKIPEIFIRFGENYFRELERKTIEKLAKSDNLLISTGGGLPIYNNLMDELNKIGLTIYLKRPAKELANRVFNSKKKRPLTDGKSYDELVYFIESGLAKREPIYEQAQLIVDRTIKNISSLELTINTFLNQQ